MTHDPLCVWAQDAPTSANCYVIEGSEPPMTTCEVIAKVRADERAKYVLPDLPRGGDHVDYCRDLACYGCEEIADGVIAQDV